MPAVRAGRRRDRFTVEGPGILSRAQREALVLGDPLTPPGPLNTGLLPGWTRADLTNVYPTSGQNISLTTANAVYENTIFWGQVRPQAAGIIFRNCLFAGRDPASVTDINAPMGAIQCFGDGYYQHTIEDSVIDPAAWMDPTLTRPGGAAPTPLAVWRKKLAGSLGLHGGRTTMIRVEILNCQDSIGFVQTRTAFFGNGVATDDPSFTHLERVWAHKSLRYKGPDYTAQNSSGDAGTHSDIFQFNTGGHVYIGGCYFGGQRDMLGYSQPGTELEPQYNSGDDFHTAALLIKQEVDSSEERKLFDIMIELNFLEGGGDETYPINHVFTPSRPNLMDPITIRNNRLVRKASGKYIIRHVNFAGDYAGNVIVDPIGTGLYDRQFVLAELAPITNG